MNDNDNCMAKTRIEDLMKGHVQAYSCMCGSPNCSTLIIEYEDGSELLVNFNSKSVGFIPPEKAKVINEIIDKQKLT